METPHTPHSTAGTQPAGTGYDFDEPVVRRGSGCYKWDETAQLGDDIVPMWVADMDFPTSPAIREALRRRVEHGVFGYTLVPDAYYDAVVSWFRRRHDWPIERSWIQYTTGVVPALSAVVKALTMPGEQVILQTPVYNCFFSSVRNNGCEVVENPLRRVTTPDGPRYVMDYDDLEAKAASDKARLLVLCNPHNPVGRVWTRDELARLNDICQRHGVLVVSDEIHNELTFGPHRYQPFAAVSAACRDNSVVCTSPSKSFNTAGLQIANIVCSNPERRRRIDRAININEICDVNPFGVVALMAAYNESEDWLDHLRSYLWQNYQALTDFFATQLPRCRVLPLEGTYLVWVDTSALGIGSDALTDRLLTDGLVQVNSGTLYGRTAGEGFIRLNIACPKAQMLEGLRRIKHVVDQL